MPILRLAPPTLSTSLSYRCQLRRLRCVQRRTVSSIRWVDNTTPNPSEEPEEPKRELSLFEELFPEEFKKPTRKESGKKGKTNDLPRLPPPDFDEEVAQAQRQRKLTTRAASTDALRHSQMTVLLLSQASKSLTESDFRRIAPKGRHIEEWRGLGDILKVIPGRDADTLEPQGHYFLIFSNPAYARAYQNHVLHLHRLAQTHTPTSIESPLAPPPGMRIDDEDVYSLLQDFALCPPSQRMYLRMLHQPYAHSIKRILHYKGYPQIVLPENKSGRAILFWVNGYKLTTFGVKTFLAKDSQDRGVQWGAVTEKGSIEVLEPPMAPNEEQAERYDLMEDVELRPKKRNFLRWICAFENEAEARRFVQTWNMRPFPMLNESISRGEPPSLVHAEFLW